MNLISSSKLLLIKDSILHHKKKTLHYTSSRSITMDAKMISDPYYVLGVERQAKFSEVKK